MSAQARRIVVPPPGYAPGQTRVPLTLGFTYPLSILPVILGALRFYVRYSIHYIGVDDWLLFVAILFTIVHSATGFWAITKGLGKHDYDLIHEGRNPPVDLTLVFTLVF